MNAIISAVAATAVLMESGAIWSLQPGRPGDRIERSEADVAYMLQGATDLQFLTDVSEGAAVAALEDACQKQEALDLSLILLDSTTDADIREEAAEALEEVLQEDELQESMRWEKFLADPSVVSRQKWLDAGKSVVIYVESILYARPLPASADAIGAQSVRERCPEVNRLLGRVWSFQEDIRRVRDAWEAIPPHLFQPPDGRKRAERAAIESGLFWEEALDVHTRRPLVTFEYQWSLLADAGGQIPNADEIIVAWAAPFRQAPPTSSLRRAERVA